MMAAEGLHRDHSVVFYLAITRVSTDLQPKVLPEGTVNPV
jgi:hypothetical protein